MIVIPLIVLLKIALKDSVDSVECNINSPGVEQLTTDRKVSGSNLGVAFIISLTSAEKRPSSFLTRLSFQPNRSGIVQHSFRIAAAAQHTARCPQQPSESGERHRVSACAPRPPQCRFGRRWAPTARAKGPAARKT